MGKTYYDIFCISPNATQEEIKIAFRRLAFQYHPDRNKDKEFCNAKMKEINFIYSILSDSEKRKWYDSTISYFTTNETEKRRTYDSQIFCSSITITDSKGRTIKVKVGDTIYYLVEIDKFVITWKHKSKEYFDVVIKNIFDPSKKDLFTQTIEFDLNKTPLFLVYWGNLEMIIYKEDFENFWINSSTFKSINKKKGIITGFFLILICILSFYYFANIFSIDSESKAKIDRIQTSNKKFREKEKAYYKKYYFATESEVNYILSKYYVPCLKVKTKTLESVELLNVPDKLGISVGEIKKGETVIKLLKCPKLYKYKIKYKNLVGWVNESSLENPFCKLEENKNHDTEE